MSKNKQTKQQQANIQSDNIEMEGFSEGVMYGGTGHGTLDSGIDITYDGMTYTMGDLGQLDLFSEEDMRGKYPALKQAWEHYQSVLEVCKTKEKEDDEN
tara:strand:+ start:46 stop:342 length:297 start_codon:yes stop_codon:yes gene_type:complete